MVKYLFLESPIWIYVLAGIAELITIAVWQNRRGRVALYLMAFWLVFAVCVGILAGTVDTGREKVQVAWDGVRQAIKDRKVDGLMKHIEDDFVSDGENKAQLRTLAGQAFKTNGPEDVSIGGGSLNEVGDTLIEVTVMARYLPARGYPTRWLVTFKEQADGSWQIAAARCLEPRGLTVRAAVQKL
jgi:hypothetical protein